MTRPVSRRDLLEGPDHLAPRAARRAARWAPRPTCPASSWRRNSSTSRCSSLGDLEVALGDQLLAVARAHAEELHRGDDTPGRWASQAARRGHPHVSPGRRPGRARAPSSRRPSRPPRPRSPGRPAPPRAARSRARGGRRGPRSACSRSRGRRRRGAARPGCGAIALAVEETSVASSRWPPVTTTTSRAERVQRAGERPRRPSGRACPAEHARLRQVGRDHGRPREQQLDQRRAGRVVEQHRARTRRPSPGRYDRRARVEQVERLVHGRDGLRRAEHADLHRVDADVARRRADLLDDERRRAPGGRPSPRPCSARSAR